MSEPAGTVLSPAAILAEAARVLSSGSYRVERGTESKLGLPSEKALVAEDKYCVVVVVVYDTWGELTSSWPTAQASAVRALSSQYTRLDRKAWDGYLVILTPALAADAEETVHAIRYDTSRIRKIVATGEDLESVADVGRALLPLLPLSTEEVEMTDSQSLLEELPGRLEEAGVDRDLAEIAVGAFKAHRPIVQELHRRLSQS